jgi:hypothetical protein
VGFTNDVRKFLISKQIDMNELIKRIEKFKEECELRNIIGSGEVVEFLSKLVEEMVDYDSVSRLKD